MASSEPFCRHRFLQEVDYELTVQLLTCTVLGASCAQVDVMASSCTQPAKASSRRSDFSKNLAEGSAAEAMAVEAYEKLTQDNEIATTEKETAVKYKTKDQKETEAALIGLKEDADGTSKELAEVLESSVCLCYGPAR